VVHPVSAVLIVQDEQALLPAALASVSFCDELLVVDSGSSDRTRELAAEAGARVLVNAPWPGFLAQRTFATQAARHDWILALDADERVSPALRGEIEQRRERGFEHAGYRLARVSFYLGRWIRGTDWYPDPQLRLFDRTRGGWQGGLVHESVQVTGGSVGRLKGALEHHPYADIGEHLRTIDRYTTLWARQAHAAGRRTSALELAGACVLGFLRNYLLKGGFRLGHVGLTVSALNASYTLAKLAKLRQLQDEAESENQPKQQANRNPRKPQTGGGGSGGAKPPAR
jgi:glycosyltransferase involved in cell wall biosynthesis